MILYLLKTHQARDHYLQFAKMISSLVLKNHYLSPYEKDEGLESVRIAEQLHQQVEVVADLAKGLSVVMHDQTLQRSLNHAANCAADSSRNLLLQAQHKSSSLASSETKDAFLTACHSTQQDCLKLVLTIERTEEQKIVRAVEWCMEKIVALEPIENLSLFEKAHKNYTEANEIVMNLANHRLDSMIDAKRAEELRQAIQSVKNSTAMLHTAVQAGIKNPTPQALAGKEFAVNRSLEALGDMLEILEQSPDVNQILQKETHFHTVVCQMTEVLQPENRMNYVKNLPIDTEACLRHVMLLAQSVTDDGEKSKLLQVSKRLLENVKSLDSQHLNLTHRADPNVLEEFSVTCDTIIQLVTDLDVLVKEITAEIVFDAFVDVANPSIALQNNAVALSKSNGGNEEDVLEELKTYLDEFRRVNSDISNVASLALAAFPFEDKSRVVSETCITLEHCGVELESLACTVATQPGNVGAGSALGRTRRGWEIHAVGVMDNVYRLMGHHNLVNAAAVLCGRDVERLRGATKRRYVQQTDEKVDGLLRHMGGMCVVVGHIVSQSPDAVYRNGLLALANQVNKAAESVRSVYSESTEDKAIVAQRIEKLDLAEQCIQRLQAGLTRSNQPGILNPIRQNVRSNGNPVPDPSSEILSPYARFLSQTKSSSSVKDLFPDANPEQSNRKDSKTSSKVEEEDLYSETVRLLEGGNEAAARSSAREITSALNSKLDLVAEYLSLSADTADNQKIKSNHDQLKKEMTDLEALLNESPKDISRIQRTLQSIKSKEESVSADVNRITSVWAQPLNRMNEALALNDSSTVQFEQDNIYNTLEAIRHIARAHLNTADSSEAEADAAQRLKRCLQLLQSTESKILDSNRPVNEREVLQWALRMEASLRNLDVFFSPVVCDVGSLSSAIAQSDNQFINRKAPALQNMAETQLRLANLTGLSIEDTRQQEKFAEECDRLQKASSNLSRLLADIPQSKTSDKSGQRKLESAQLALREWASSMSVMEGLIDQHCGNVSRPVDKVIGAAHYVRQANRGASKESLKNDFQNCADDLQSEVISVRSLTEQAYRNYRDPRVAEKALQAAASLSSTTPIIVSESRKLFDSASNQNYLNQLRREWSVAALYLIHLLDNSPDVPRSQVAAIKSRMGVPLGKPKQEAPRDESDAGSKAEGPWDEEDGPESTRRKGKKKMLSRSNTMTLLNAAKKLKTELEERWDDEGNLMIQAARKLAHQMHDLAEFTRGQPPLETKEDFVNTAKAISANGQIILKFAKIIADRCQDQPGLGENLRKSCDPIEMLGRQLSIVASVKAVCPEKHETDEALVTNAENLLKAVSSTLASTEACCVRDTEDGGLQPKDGDDKEGTPGFEAIRLADRWRKRLHDQRRAQANAPMDSAKGLRRTDASSIPSMQNFLKHSGGGSLSK